jgi:hypothetical protein
MNGSDLWLPRTFNSWHTGRTARGFFNISPATTAIPTISQNSASPILQICNKGVVGLHVSRQKLNRLMVVSPRLASPDEEEAEVQLTKIVPFLVEDELKRLGAAFEKAPKWQPFSIVDGRLVTGQNPASSTSAARALLKLLGVQRAA